MPRVFSISLNSNAAFSSAVLIGVERFFDAASSLSFSLESLLSQVKFGLAPRPWTATMLGGR